MGATAKKVMDMAVSYLGTKEHPADSNNVIFNTHYYGREVNGSNYAWCAVFLWDIFRMAGAPELYYGGSKTAYVPTLVSWGKKAGLIVPTKEAKYGDIVIFDWNGDGSGDHCGFVESVTNGQYICIEGNTAVGNDSNGGEVMRRTRNASQILCVIRPEYDSEIAFDDVTSDRWSYEAIKHVASRGLMIGVDSTHFDPTGAVTREQLATVLHRLLELNT